MPSPFYDSREYLEHEAVNLQGFPLSQSYLCNTLENIFEKVEKIKAWAVRKMDEIRLYDSLSVKNLCMGHEKEKYGIISRYE